MRVEVGVDLVCEVFPFLVVHSFVVEDSSSGTGFMSGFALEGIWKGPMRCQDLVIALGARIRVVSIIRSEVC